MPPGPGSFDLPAGLQRSGSVWASPSRCSSSCWPPSWSFGFFYARRAPARHGAGQAAVRRRGAPTASSATRLGRDIIGSHDFMRFVPYLVTLFFFILRQQPVRRRSRSSSSRRSPARAWSTGSPLLSWVIYNSVGIRKHGFVGYLKLQCVPGGVTGPILVLMVPLEFMSNIIVRPVTLALRLFANMFAGHILLLLFATRRRVPPGARRRSLHQAGRHPGLAARSSRSRFLELLVQFLQAYVFVLLNAMYISGALADEH